MEATHMLTYNKRMALAVMAEDRIGAVVTKFGWTWPQGVREDEEKAIAVLAALRPAKCNLKPGQEFKPLPELV
jgi:hypothetical protein